MKNTTRVFPSHVSHAIKMILYYLIQQRQRQYQQQKQQHQQQQ